LINDINGKFPDSERWVHSPQLKKKLNAALDWAEKTPPKSSNLSVKSTKASKSIKRISPTYQNQAF
jgi:hypothetical protein